MYLTYENGVYTAKNENLGQSVEIKFFTANLARVTIKTMTFFAGDDIEQFTCEKSELENRLPAWVR